MDENQLADYSRNETDCNGDTAHEFRGTEFVMGDKIELTEERDEINILQTEKILKVVGSQESARDALTIDAPEGANKTHSRGQSLENDNDVIIDKNGNVSPTNEESIAYDEPHSLPVTADLADCTEEIKRTNQPPDIASDQVDSNRDSSRRNVNEPPNGIISITGKVSDLAYLDECKVLNDSLQILLGELTAINAIETKTDDGQPSEANRINRGAKTREQSISNFSTLVQHVTDQAKQLKKQFECYAAENMEITTRNRKLVEQLEEEQEDKEERINSLKEHLSLLEKQASEAHEEAKQSKDRLIAHDAAAKRAITSIQNECSIKVAQVTKMFEDAVVEKDGMLIKLSKKEDDLMRVKKEIEMQEKKSAEFCTEMDRMKQLVKDKDIEVKKGQVAIEEKEKNLADAKAEIVKLKEEVNSTGVKIKWAQNKLKQELESHKETKKQITVLTTKLQESKEEGEQIRRACHEMIQQYQNSEEMRSVQLDHKLKETENAVKLHEHEIAIQDEAHRLKTQELEALKISHRKAKERILEMQDQIASLEDKYSACTSEVSEYHDKLDGLQKEKNEWEGTVKALEEGRDELKRYDQQVRYYQTLESNLRAELHDLTLELKGCKQKEAELLNFSEKLADNNAQAMTTASSLEAKVKELTEKNADLEKQLHQAKEQSTIQIQSSVEQSENREKVIRELNEQLTHKEKIISELSGNLEDAQDEIRVVKRKNTAALKDLQRQLQQSKKKMEQMECALGDSQENLSNKSRTSSNCSLDKLSSTSPHYASNPSLTGMEHVETTAEYSIVQPSKHLRGNHIKGDIEVDKSLLVERICKLQKAHAKKNDKLEFLEEHINTLVEELQRKNRIIQFYIDREEVGTLAPNRSDRNKAEMSRKGGIMASVYSSRPSDKDMTLDLSLEINRKLQAVLEDTLLKNITLKESINTLGEEIGKLQREKSSDSCSHNP